MGIELLTGVREKVIRARQHLKTFNAQVAAWQRTSPHGIRRQYEDHIPEKSGRPGLTWRAWVNNPPPVRLSIIAGDVIHNLRSALDHLAWALVLENGGEPNDEGRPKTQFVIRTKPRIKYGTQPLVIATKSGSISPAAQCIIEAVQPHDRPEKPLYALLAMSNIDKHRTLLIASLSMGQITLKTPDGGMTVHAFRSNVEDGTMICWILRDATTFDPNIELNPEFTPNVLLSDIPAITIKKTVPAGKFLANLVQSTRDAVIQPLALAGFGTEIDFS